MNAPDRAAWLAQRKSGLGGSDIAAILGLSPWRSPVDVWLDKTSNPTDVEMNEAMFWGTILEDVVAKHYADTEHVKVQRIGVMMRHPQNKWMLANIDRAIVTPGSRARFDGGKLLGADGILECKTASAYKSGEWGRDGDDEAVPVYYTAQCMHYLAVTGLEWCDIAVLIGGQKYLSKRIVRDDETIRGMVERAEEFWFRHVVERVPPEPTCAADAIKLYPRDSGINIEANEKTVTLLARARELKDQIAALELELDGDRKRGIMGVMDRIKSWMGDASAITLGGETLATWRAAKDSVKTDYKAVIDRLREIYKGEETMLADIGNAITTNTTTVAGSRRFILK